VSGETSNLVSETLTWDNSDFITDFLVGLEIESKTWVVLFDEDTGSLLNGFSSDTTMTLSILTLNK
jgi:hypothetical protein